MKSLADAKNGFPTLLWLGESVIFCTIAVRLLFRRIREIRVQKSILRILWILREDSRILFAESA